MNVACPECSTVYRIDPAKLPDGEVRSRCRECDTTIMIGSGPAEPGAVVTARRVVNAPPPPTPEAEATPESATAPATGRPGVPVFGPQDPQTRARRLARALVSDLKVYNRERWDRSRSAGTLRKDFRDEIMKSWAEYVEQVGETMAKQTPYFRDALNDILAEGDRIF